MDSLLMRMEHPVEEDARRFDIEVDHIVDRIVSTVSGEMRYQPASMVYELLTTHLARRQPGVPVDDEALRLAAARIAVGLPAH